MLPSYLRRNEAGPDVDSDGRLEVSYRLDQVFSEHYYFVNFTRWGSPLLITICQNYSSNVSLESWELLPNRKI